MARSPRKYRLMQNRRKKKAKVRKLINRYRRIKTGKLQVSDTYTELKRLTEKIERRRFEVPEEISA